ncbi:MAG: 1-deoxy-D-xylulose-5-phosphate synthase N-terminal domain-containing protein, partial [Pseudothermotoga sp.]
MNLDDVVGVDVAKLKQLSQVIRKRIIEVVSMNGGHLSSNLGVVELTLALYNVFDPRQDIVVWDTSHQSYTHK